MNSPPQENKCSLDVDISEWAHQDIGRFKECTIGKLFSAKFASPCNSQNLKVELKKRRTGGSIISINKSFDAGLYQQVTNKKRNFCLSTCSTFFFKSAFGEGNTASTNLTENGPFPPVIQRLSVNTRVPLRKIDRRCVARKSTGGRAYTSQLSEPIEQPIESVNPSKPIVGIDLTADNGEETRLLTHRVTKLRFLIFFSRLT